MKTRFFGIIDKNLLISLEKEESNLYTLSFEVSGIEAIVKGLELESVKHIISCFRKRLEEFEGPEDLNDIEFKFFWNSKKHTWNYWAYWPNKTRTFICSWPAYQPTQFELDNIRRVFLRGLSCRKEHSDDPK